LTGRPFTSFKNYKDIIDENSQLKKEVARLVIDYVRLNNLESENSYLRRELNFIQEKHFNYEVADIIGRQAYNDQILILAKGSADGLKVGQAITVDQGIIVGKILSTEDHRAYAALLTEVRSQLAVSLESLSGTNGLLLGRVGSSLLMDLIPQDKTVAKDNLVITSGLEEGIPRGLLVGRISQVDSLATRRFSGSSLGLALSKRLALKVGYDLAYRNRPNMLGIDIIEAPVATPPVVLGKAPVELKKLDTVFTTSLVITF